MWWIKIIQEYDEWAMYDCLVRGTWCEIMFIGEVIRL